MQWVMNQWATAEAEAVRLQKELDEAHRTLTKSEAKFAHVRKMLDGEKREKNIYLKKYNEQVSFFFVKFCILEKNYVYCITFI